MKSRCLPFVVVSFLLLSSSINPATGEDNYKLIFQNVKTALASESMPSSNIKLLDSPQSISNILGDSFDFMDLLIPYIGDKQNLKNTIKSLSNYKFTLRSAKSTEVYQNAVHATVLIIAPNIGSGAGFVIDRTKGLIITNFHVTSGIKNLLVALYNPDIQDPAKLKFYPATLVRYSAKRDIAILKLKSVPTQLSELKLDDTKQVVGNEAHLIGHPLSLVWTYSHGTVTAIRNKFQFGEEKIADVVQIDASISPGNSGGPLLSDSGEVIGLVTFSNVGENAQNLNFAVSSKEIKEFLLLAINEETKISGAIRKIIGMPLFSVNDILNECNAYKVDKDKNGEYDYISLVDKKTNKESYRYSKGVEFDMEHGKKIKANLLTMDLNEDGAEDIILIDTDLNLKFDLMLADINYDGDPDIVGIDADGKGKISEAWII